MTEKPKKQHAQWVLTRILPPEHGFSEDGEPIDAADVVSGLLERFKTLLTEEGNTFKFQSTRLDVIEHEGWATLNFAIQLDGDEE